MFAEVVQSFGKSDVTLFSEKMLISTSCISGFMPNLNKNLRWYLTVTSSYSMIVQKIKEIYRENTGDLYIK